MKHYYTSIAFVYLISTIFLCTLSSFNPHKEAEPVSFFLTYKKNAKTDDTYTADKKFILESSYLSYEIKASGKRNQKDKNGKIALSQTDLQEIKKLVNQYELYKDYRHNCIESKKPSFQLNFKIFIATYSIPRTRQFMIQIQGGESLLSNEMFNSMEVLIAGLEKIIQKKR